MANKWKGNINKIREDFFQTPEEVIVPVLKFIPDNVKIIWEATYGRGGIGDVLEKAGYKVIKTDLYPKTLDTKELNFLTHITPPKCDFIMLNPPFCLKTKFLEKLCKIGIPFMFIAPLTILETEKRSKLFNDYKLSIINLSRRTQYKKDLDIAFKDRSNVWFHSVWVLSDGLGKIHYVKIKKP